jgi:hypothetical protein
MRNNLGNTVVIVECNAISVIIYKKACGPRGAFHGWTRWGTSGKNFLNIFFLCKIEWVKELLFVAVIQDHVQRPVDTEPVRIIVALFPGKFIYFMTHCWMKSFALTVCVVVHSLHCSKARIGDTHLLKNVIFLNVFKIIIIIYVWCIE